MLINCLECGRLLEESNAAVRSHAEILGQAYRLAGNNLDDLIRMKLEPRFLESVKRRQTTRRAVSAHQTTHPKPGDFVVIGDSNVYTIEQVGASGSRSVSTVSDYCSALETIRKLAVAARTNAWTYESGDQPVWKLILA
jgi:hypothetical protein